MLTIHKYHLNEYETKIKIPQGAEVLSAEFQRGILCVWAKVDDSNDLVDFSFRVHFTGSEIPLKEASQLTFIDTCHAGNGLVYHVFKFQ